MATLIWISFPLLGAAAGWALQAVSGWLAEQPVPKRRLFELVADLPELPRATAAVALGLVFGLIVAGVAAAERLSVRVTPELITLTRGDGAERRLERGTVDLVFNDRKQLVLLDESTAELARERHDLKESALRSAFVTHGYPWRDGDPHERDYRPWVKAVADLPPGVDALFQARERALQRRKEDDAHELRNELARLGFVVRDRSKRQYWRRTVDRTE